MPSPGAPGHGAKRQESGNVTDPDDGPKPMKDCKPAKMVPNSVDQFRQTHQAEYEARAKGSSDDVERVQRHYATYPALRDELDKRRSTARITTARIRGRMVSDSMCSVCLRLRGRKPRRNIRTRGHGRRSRPYKAKDRRYRTGRYSREVYRNKRVSHKYNRARSHEEVTSPREGSVSVNENKSRSEVGSRKNPSVTSGYTVSSYHSYPSTDHEPMVS